MCSAPSDHFVEAIHQFPIVFACKLPRNNNYAGQPAGNLAAPFELCIVWKRTEPVLQSMYPSGIPQNTMQHKFGKHSFGERLGSMTAMTSRSDGEKKHVRISLYAIRSMSPLGHVFPSAPAVPGCIIISTSGVTPTPNMRMRMRSVKRCSTLPWCADRSRDALGCRVADLCSI